MTQTTIAAAAPTVRASATYRWMQLILGVICMIAAANIQYAWTLFVPEIQKTFGWQRASIQTAFTIFILVQTWLTPLEGYLIDRFGPRIMVLIGGFFTGLAWIIDSYANSLVGYYAASAIGGIGVGCVYARSALTIIPIANMIAAGNFQGAFFWYGLIQGIIIMLASLALRAPQAGETKASTTLVQSKRDYTLFEAARSPVFYVLFAMFIMTVTGGLMAVAQLGPMSQDLGVKDTKVNLYFFAIAALPFALLLDRIMNGISRPLFGWISDHIGRENTMFVAFMLEGCGIIALGEFGNNPWAFVFLSGLVFLAWGEVYSLFSATSGDAFGTKNIGSIYGVLYCAKGIASLLVPLGNLISEATGSWSTVLFIVAGMDITAALCALVLLKPILRRHLARSM